MRRCGNQRIVEKCPVPDANVAVMSFKINFHHNKLGLGGSYTRTFLYVLVLDDPNYFNVNSCKEHENYLIVPQVIIQIWNYPNDTALVTIVDLDRVITMMTTAEMIMKYGVPAHDNTATFTTYNNSFLFIIVLFMCFM